MRRKCLLPLLALLLTLTLTVSAVPALGAGTGVTVKKTGAGVAHLRAEPTINSESLTLFAAGAPVEVHSIDGNWAYVTVNGISGYISTYLLEGDLSSWTAQDEQTLTAEASTPAASGEPLAASSGWITVNTTMYIYTGNSGRLHLREYASRDSRSLGLYSNGTAVQVLASNGEWGYVNVLGAAGYMMLRFLSTSYNPEPTPIPSGDWETMYIYTGNSGRLHLRQAASRSSRSLGLYSNGTQLSAINLGNGWCYVSVLGATGYMMTRYLSTTPYSPSPDGSPIGTAVVHHPNNSFVYLRSSRSTASLANVLAKVPSGTTVTVYERDEWYCRISYNGMTGYMVSWYLYGSSSGSSGSSSVPTGGSVLESRTVRHPNNSFVYMRSSRTTKDTSNVICKVPSGTTVDVYEKDEWYCRICYNGVFGYMVTQYLYGSSSSGASSSIPISGSPIDTAVVRHPNNSFVYLRSSKSTANTSNVICKVPSGSVVDVYERGQWYCKIVYSGMAGYMVTQYLYGSSTGGARVWASNGGSINLRASCSTENDSNILAQMPCGSSVQVLEWGSSWSRISYNGIVGYVISGFLQTW